MKRILCMTLMTVLAAGAFGNSPAEARDVPEILKSEDFRKLGLASFPWMKLTQSPRAAAMGDAFTAVSNDINAIFSNPAGLVHLKRFGYQLSHTRWLVDTGFYSGAFAYRTGWGVLGASVLNWDVGDMPVRTIFNPEGTGEMIKGGGTSVGLAYAFHATDKLGLGVRVVYISETLHVDNMTSLVLDAGTHFYTGFRSSRIALAMRNFGPDTKVLAEDQKFLMPMNFDIGVAMELFGQMDEPNYLTVSFASSYQVDYEQRWQIGSELWLSNAVALRAGYKFNHDLETYSFGAGFKGNIGDRTVLVDVAYTNVGELLDAPIRFSIGGAF